MSCFLDFFSIYLSSVAVEGNFSSGGSKFGNTQQTNDIAIFSYIIAGSATSDQLQNKSQTS